MVPHCFTVVLPADSQESSTFCTLPTPVRVWGGIDNGLGLLKRPAERQVSKGASKPEGSRTCHHGALCSCITTYVYSSTKGLVRDRPSSRQYTYTPGNHWHNCICLLSILCLNRLPTSSTTSPVTEATSAKGMRARNAPYITYESKIEQASGYNAYCKPWWWSQPKRRGWVIRGRANFAKFRLVQACELGWPSTYTTDLWTDLGHRMKSFL